MKVQTVKLPDGSRHYIINEDVDITGMPLSKASTYMDKIKEEIGESPFCILTPKQYSIFLKPYTRH